MLSVKVSGGERLRTFIARARAAQSVKGVAIGFFGEDRTARGSLPADLHAKLIEFGGGPFEERPFLRAAIPAMRRAAMGVIAAGMRKRLAVDKALARRAGEAAREVLRDSLREHKVRDTGELEKAVRVVILT